MNPLFSENCIRLIRMLSDLTPRCILGAVFLCLYSTSAFADKASYPQWSIAVANEKCKLWDEYGYDYYEVRKHMKVPWTTEFEKEFSLLPYQEALELSRYVTGSMCEDLQDEAWERFRDKQVNSGVRDDLK